jgi:predicted 3-demethylubiquinone-9 3-methyltransferase (glyoxalase superfamily)
LLPTTILSEAQDPQHPDRRRRHAMRKIRPCLWFDGNAEEAVKFYMSIFENAQILDEMRHGDAGPGRKGSVLTLTCKIADLEFIALNGGPHYTFTPAMSLFVTCESQQEVDHYWERLLDGGKAMACGWLTDKFGVSWQIVPAVMEHYLTDKDAEKSQRVMQAMMKMVKLDIAELTRAYESA